MKLLLTKFIVKKKIKTILFSLSLESKKPSMQFVLLFGKKMRVEVALRRVSYGGSLYLVYKYVFM